MIKETCSGLNELQEFKKLVFCFFFSSRRRHTRWTDDWSSDVYSSDLRVRRDPAHHQRPPRGRGRVLWRQGRLVGVRRRPHPGPALRRGCPAERCRGADRGRPRSEERRIGKECRSRWSPCGGKEKMSGG